MDVKVNLDRIALGSHVTSLDASRSVRRLFLKGGPSQPANSTKPTPDESHTVRIYKTSKNKEKSDCCAEFRVQRSLFYAANVRFTILTYT